MLIFQSWPSNSSEADQTCPRRLVREKSPPAPAALKARMTAIWRDYLLEIGFMEPDMADHMMAAMSRIFARGALTEDDVRILMGIVRQSRWAVSQGPRRNPETPSS